MRILKTLMLMFLGFSLTNCNLNKRNTGIQYMPDMADSPAIKAQRDFLDPPPGSVARNATLYPETAEESEQVLKNPLPASEENLAEGKAVFEITCIVCHGPSARGDGSLTSAYPKAPDLTLDQVRGRADGWYFHRISFGIGTMPGYRHSTTVKERWQIIHYLRTLQAKANE